MTTQVKINSNIVKRVLQASNSKNKKQAIEEALVDYLQIKERSSILELFGKVDFREGYDYKAMRNRQ